MTTAFKPGKFCVPPGRDLFPPRNFCLEIHLNCDTSLHTKSDMQVRNDFYFYYYFLRFLDPFCLLKAELL